MLFIISWITYFLFTIGLLSAAFYCFMRYKHTYWKRRGISSAPSCHWLFGHIKDAVTMRTSAGVILGNLHQQASDTDDVLGIYILYKPFLLLRNPEVIKQILIKDFHIFSERSFSAKSFRDKIGSSNLFTVHNPEWKYLRMKMTPVFTSGKLKKLFYLMVETSESMKKYLHSQFGKDVESSPILVVDTFTKYTTDVISSLAFGISTNSFEIPVPEFYAQSLKFVTLDFMRAVRFFFMFFFPQFAHYMGGQMLASATDYFRKIFWDSMDAREASKQKRGDLIDSLIDLKNEKQDNDFKFEGDVLLSQSAIFFFAGRDSSVSTMTFTLYELAKHPEIQKRTREEILNKVKTQGLTYEAVQEMKYLHQVISEVLRFYPPAPIIDRVNSEDYRLPGSDIVIEKGTPVYLALFGIHNDPRYYSNPAKFDPDRFSEERKSEIHQCTYLPFGDGPRNCIGLRAGMLQTAVGLITVLKDFEVSLHSAHTSIVEPRSIFLSPPSKLQLKLTKIS